MKKNLITITLGLSILGCHTIPEDLAAKKGWRFEHTAQDQFRIFVPVSELNAQSTSLPVAASILIRQGYESFEMLKDKEFPQSGTTFFWGDSYGGAPGIFEWEIGTSFLVKGYKRRPDGIRVLDTQTVLSDYTAKQKNKK